MLIQLIELFASDNGNIDNASAFQCSKLVKTLTWNTRQAKDNGNIDNASAFQGSKLIKTLTWNTRQANEVTAVIPDTPLFKPLYLSEVMIRD